MSAPKIDRNLEIYEKWKEGKTQFQLAVEYGVHTATIAQVINWAKKNYGQDRNVQ